MPIKPIVKRLLKRRLGSPTQSELELTDKLRKQISDLPELKAQNKSAAVDEWIGYRMQVRELIATTDPRCFIDWDVIRKTMFVGNAGYIAEELDCLRSSGAWRERWRKVLREDALGRPPRSRYYLKSSNNLIHHAYTIYRFEQATGRSIEQFPRIIEFGGGYGGFCRLVHRLGFRGEYLIFDLPEFSNLQHYFLTSLGLPVRMERNVGGISCISDLGVLREAMAANSDWLFVALWSLSETSLELRREFLKDPTIFASYLIAYQDQFLEIDNIKFFRELTGELDNVNWRLKEIPHLPGNQYLFGTRS
jgi:hypothetical protein